MVWASFGHGMPRAAHAGLQGVIPQALWQSSWAGHRLRCSSSQASSWQERGYSQIRLRVLTPPALAKRAPSGLVGGGASAAMAQGEQAHAYVALARQDSDSQVPVGPGAGCCARQQRVTAVHRGLRRLFTASSAQAIALYSPPLPPPLPLPAAPARPLNHSLNPCRCAAEHGIAMAELAQGEGAAHKAPGAAASSPGAADGAGTSPGADADADARPPLSEADLQKAWRQLGWNVALFLLLSIVQLAFRRNVPGSTCACMALALAMRYG